MLERGAHRDRDGRGWRTIGSLLLMKGHLKNLQTHLAKGETWKVLLRGFWLSYAGLREDLVPQEGKHK